MDGLINDENKKLCWDVLVKYGVFHQRKMVVEECSELIQALCKLDREDNAAHYENYIEEMADVVAVLQQNLQAEGIGMDELNRRIKAKLLRALED